VSTDDYAMWSKLSERELEIARLENDMRMATVWSKGPSNPFAAQYKPPTMHHDWLTEWTEVSPDKVLNLLRAGVAVHVTERCGMDFARPIPQVPEKFMEKSWDAIPDFTAYMILARYNDCAYLVRTE